MAEIVGCLAMSHAPQLMLEPAQWGLLNTRSWDPLPERPDLQSQSLEDKQRQWQACHDAIRQLAAKLAALAPDTVIVVGDDQHENLLDDNMPPFTLFLGDEVEASVSLRYLEQPLTENRTRYQVDTTLGRWLVDELMEAGFDPAYSLKTRYEGGLGHAFARPLKFLMPDPPPAILPIMVNTYYPPAPSPKRCVRFGQTVADLVARFPSARRVVLLASGGLSHTKLDPRLDHDFVAALERADIAYLEAMRPAHVLAYHPLYRTTTGVGCGMAFAAWSA
jgi:3-O-methylgallate 3,4-dioxygenase